jgi:hypothetical protein
MKEIFTEKRSKKIKVDSILIYFFQASHFLIKLVVLRIILLEQFQISIGRFSIPV